MVALIEATEARSITIEPEANLITYDSSFNIHKYYRIEEEDKIREEKHIE